VVGLLPGGIRQQANAEILPARDVFLILNPEHVLVFPAN